MKRFREYLMEANAGTAVPMDDLPASGSPVPTDDLPSAPKTSKPKTKTQPSPQRGPTTKQPSSSPKAPAPKQAKPTTSSKTPNTTTTKPTTSSKTPNTTTTKPTKGSTKPVIGKTAQSYSGTKYGYNSPDEVSQIQQQLVSMGYNMPVDGKWGPKTQSAYTQAYTQMYGSAPGTDSKSLDPNAAGGQVTATAKTGPKGAATFTNTPRGATQGAPDAWTQANIAKQGQSADIAAAAGMPNPYLKPQQTGSTAPAQKPATTGSNFDARGKITGMPGPVTSAAAPMGRDAKGKPYTDWTGNNPQPGAKSLGESELGRIKNLVNYKK